MKPLRCCGPRCSILSRSARAEYELDLLAGRCLCREALERSDRRYLGARAPVEQSDEVNWADSIVLDPKLYYRVG